MPINANELTVEIEPNRPLLSNVSLRIEDGEFVLILGPSGSGKSIFGLCLNGIIPSMIPAHYTGSLLVDDLEAGQTPVSTMSTRVGIVFQDPDAQLVTMHVEDEIVFGPENLRLSRSEIAHNLEHALHLVGMQDFRHAHTFALSGGQKQRVAIGSVLAMRPSVLVLDEPTSNLDPEGTRAVFEILARLRREKQTTIIAIEHKVDELIEHVDRLVVFDRGHIIANGPPREVLALHGEMLAERGVGIPQIAELALSARRKGLCLRNEDLPITVSEMQKKWPIEPLLRPAKNVPANATSKETIVRFENVAFDYPNRSAILRNMDLSISRGELVALVGRNGAGKSTLTKLVVGLLEATHGRVLLEGKDVLRLRAEHLSEKVGYVFQYPDTQLMTDTVFDEVAFSLRIRKLPEAVIAAKVAQVLEEVELVHLESRHPLTLSMGEKRRLSVATVLVLDPQMLILDEPTMGMDSGHISSIMTICEKLVSKGRAVLMVTHDMRVVAQWATRVIALAEGQILLDGAPRDFFLSESSLRATGLSQLSICPWRRCANDQQASCRTCPKDVLDIFVNKYASNRGDSP